MKNIIRKILFLIPFLFLSVNNNYSKGTSTLYEYESNSGTTTEFKEFINLNDLIFNIQENNIIFTQDDEYYYFDITQNFTGHDEGYGFCRFHNFYKNTYFIIAPFSNTEQVSFYNYTRYTTKSYTKENYFKLGSEIISEYESFMGTGDQTIKKNMTKYSFISSMYEGPKGDQSGFKFVSSYNNISNTTNFTSNCKFGIKKEYIENFRYFRFIFPFYFDRNTSNSGNSYLYSSGVSNYSIDLTNYINCEHSFLYDNKDYEKHIKECINCKWQIEEEHIYFLKYDEINNNKCECGNIKLVSFVLCDINNEEIIKLTGTPSEIIDYTDKNIPGMTFIDYECYQLVNDDWEKLEPFKTDKILTNFFDLSIKYVKNVKIHKYNLIFNKENYLDLELQNNMEMQTINCGIKTKIKKNEYNILGYSFLGWSIKPNIDEVIFKDEETILDLSFEDNKNINLYPVFSPYSYIINYNYNVNNIIKTKQYEYNKNEKLEKFDLKLDNEKYFSGWEYKNEIIKTDNTIFFDKFVESGIKKFDLYAFIKTPSNGSEYGSSDENSPSKKFDNNKNIENKNINNNEIDDKNIEKKNKTEKLLNDDLKNNISKFISNILNLNVELEYIIDDKINSNYDYNKHIKNENNKQFLNSKRIKNNNIFLSEISFNNFKIYIIYFLIFFTLFFIIFILLLLIKKTIDKYMKKRE